MYLTLYTYYCNYSYEWYVKWFLVAYNLFLFYFHSDCCDVLYLNVHTCLIYIYVLAHYFTVLSCSKVPATLVWVPLHSYNGEVLRNPWKSYLLFSIAFTVEIEIKSTFLSISASTMYSYDFFLGLLNTVARVLLMLAKLSGDNQVPLHQPRYTNREAGSTSEVRGNTCGWGDSMRHSSHWGIPYWHGASAWDHDSWVHGGRNGLESTI